MADAALIPATDDVAAAARRYVASWRALADAEPLGVLDALVERDDAFHALVASLGERCPLCEVGTCPYVDDVEDYDPDWWEPYRPVETVDDPDGLLNERRP